MLKRTRVRHSAYGLTGRKRIEAGSLTRAFTAARQRAIECYWTPERFAEVLLSPRKLVEKRRAAGTLVGEGLTTHYSKLALESGLAAVRGSWLATLHRVRELVGRNPTLTEAERHWLRCVLNRPAELQTCLDRGVVTLVLPWAMPLDQARLSRKVRRLVLRHRTALPRPPKSEWLELDTNCYRVFRRAEDRHFKGAWLALTGASRGHRLNIPLAGISLQEFAPRTGKTNSKPGLRLSVDGERLRFMLVERLESAPNAGTITAGVDKGYRTLLTVSLGDPQAVKEYGPASYETIARVAEQTATRSKNRRRLVSYERSLRNTKPAISARIRRNNLGHVKSDRQSRSEKARLRQHIGRSLNEMFSGLIGAGVKKLVVEDLSFFSERTLGRTSNRRLGRWLKGHLQRALAYKAELYGVQLWIVNAAYTSQTCPRCGYPSPKNRRGEWFECRACSYTGGADAVAATNVLRRGSDSAITRWTRRERVYQILHERWQSALTGGAWDSSGPDDGSGSSSREQLLTRVGQAHT